MIYAKVINGEVVAESNKPKSKKTSNLWLNQEALKEEGWLPLDRKDPEPGKRVVEWEYEILTTKVNKKPIQLEDVKPETAEWENAKRTTKTRLSDKYVQEYGVVEIALEEFKANKKAQVRMHARESLFEVPFSDLETWVSTQISAIDAASTHADVAAVITTYN